MNKMLLGLMAVAFAGSVNAATITHSTANDFDVTVNNTYFDVAATNATTTYWDVDTFATPDTDFAFTLSALTGTANTMIVNVYNDIDQVEGSVTFNSSAALYTLTLTSLSPTATFSLLPGSYAFTIKTVGTNNVGGGVGGAVASIPVPAAAWLFGSALFGAGALRRKQNAA